MPTAPTNNYDKSDGLMVNSKTLLGFWIYIMTDCVLFATLFATFVVMRSSTNGGVSGSELFSLPYILIETLILLVSSFICGLALVAAQRAKTAWVILGLVLTILLGTAFLTLEINEFHHLAQEGNSWRNSGFLSAFFSLVGTHGAHIAAGIIWMLVMIGYLTRRGLDNIALKRLTMVTLFWHFLDIIWIFIFSIVYLFGAIT